MIYFLAGLEKDSYALLRDIFSLFEQGKLDKIPKSRQHTNSKHDCKGSNFKGLRGLEDAVVNQLLLEIKQKKISLKQLGGKCTRIKKLVKTKAVFLKHVGIQSWEKAVAKFPLFTTEEALQPYLSNPDSGALAHHCRKALKSATTRSSQENLQNVTVIPNDGQDTVTALFESCASTIDNNVITSALPTFTGFQVAFASVGTEVEAETMITELLRLVKSVNILNAEDTFCIIIHCGVKEIPVVEQVLLEQDMMTEVLLWVRERPANIRTRLFGQQSTAMIFATNSYQNMRQRMSSFPSNVFSGDLEKITTDLLQVVSSPQDWILHYEGNTCDILNTARSLNRNSVAVGECVRQLEASLFVDKECD